MQQLALKERRCGAVPSVRGESCSVCPPAPFHHQLRPLTLWHFNLSPMPQEMGHLDRSSWGCHRQLVQCGKVLRGYG